MSAPLQIIANAVAAQIRNADREVKLIVSDLLSYQVAAAEFSKSFKSGHWDGRSSLFQFQRGVFPAGFMHLVHGELKARGYEPQIIRSPLPAPLGPEDPIVDSFGNDDPRYDYQMETVNRLLRQGRMIAQVATGGGKSKIAKLATARIKRGTLFLTTRSILMYQMKTGYEENGLKVGVLGDSEWTPQAGGVNVGMVQTLVARLEETDIEREMEKLLEAQSNAEKKELEAINAKLKAMKARPVIIKAALAKLKEKQEKARRSDEEIVRLATERAGRQQATRALTLELLDTIELLIGEEAHEVGGDSYWRITKDCKKAHYRLALTATPFMKADAEDNMQLMAAFGSIGITISEKMLIERGILAQPIFRFLSSDSPTKLRRSSGWATAYDLGIVKNESRNQKIVYEATRAAGYGLPVMILVTRKAHGATLEKLLKAAGVGVRFIQGETDHSDRQRALKELAAGKIKVLIGTTILDVGVDVPAVGLVILAGGYKAEVQLRQRIGRGLRAKKAGPNLCFFIDFTDHWNIHTRTHASERQQIVMNTPGFAENVLPTGHDFDYSVFALAA